MFYVASAHLLIAFRIQHTSASHSEAQDCSIRFHKRLIPNGLNTSIGMPSITIGLGQKVDGEGGDRPGSTHRLMSQP